MLFFDINKLKNHQSFLENDVKKLGNTWTEHVGDEEWKESMMVIIT